MKLTIAPDADSVRPPAWDRDPAVRALRNPDGSIWAYSYADGSELWMHLPGIASFRFGSRAEEALVVPEPCRPPIALAMIEDDYRRAVLPMALQAHGQEVIHASAVITEDGVVAFCGRSQTGKSTVAYGLHRRGYRVWADDTLVFDASAEFVQVIPYPHRLRIRSASLRTVKWCDIDGLVMSNDDASSPAVRSPPDSSRRISRRVGSDKALKTALSPIITNPFAQTEDLFRIPSNYLAA